MIEYTKGNILEAKTDAIVNTVNTVGVMGRGIALQFKKAFPENYRAYAEACKRGEVKTGRMFVFPMPRLSNPRYIINFPTKEHWRGKSKPEYIRIGLEDLVATVQNLRIESIALPPLGCGLGGLPWAMVKSMVEGAFANVPARVVFYEPLGAPHPDEMINRTQKPPMTLGRAVVLVLMDRYASPLFQEFVSLLEVQKLAYFQQVAGENLKLKFAKGRFGPYADNLRHVLNTMDGHYISGWGDGQNRPRTPLHLLDGAKDAANTFIETYPETSERFGMVTKLVEGFETPYGMELLSTVHWVLRHELGNKPSIDDITLAVKSWTKRKGNLFTKPHIETAYRRLIGNPWTLVKENGFGLN